MDRHDDVGTMDVVPDFEVTLLEPRPFRPFKTSEEYLYAMKEDLAEWLNGLYDGLQMDADNFFEQTETGVIICQHANNVVRKARDYYKSGGTVPADVQVPDRDVVYRYDVLPETFHARDNVSNFISWCRSLNIKECLLFETDDLVLRKNERSFILCLLEVARRGVKFGMPAPLLVQLEQEIDAEIANDDDGYETLFRQAPQVVTNDLRSLHERVVALLSRCTCPSQFPMIRVADGKYRIGDTKVLIFVRILRSHVMVRVGGGWDTLEHYLDKHDPCRCKSGHRLATSARLTMLQNKSSIPSMHVTYNRPSQATSTPPSSPQMVRKNILAYSSPKLNRRIHHQSSPPGGHRSLPPPPPPPPCSDDSSNSSIHESLERRNSKPFESQVCGSSSEDEEVESDDGRGEYRIPRRRPIPKREFLKDTVPSSWRYSPGIPRKEYKPAVTVNGHLQRKSSDGTSSRLPAMAQICEGKQPPKVGKVSPRPHIQSNWNDQRSQSSEDLLQNHSSGPARPKDLVFHSRGSSPVNMKGRTSLQSSDTNSGFRRNDFKRHSSPRINQRQSPPKAPSRRSNVVNPGHHQVIPGTTPPTRRMFWSPERQNSSILTNNSGKFLNRKNSAPVIESFASPVVEKLLQHSDLCSDVVFLKKIEQLIAEYQNKTIKDDPYTNGVHVKFSSLPATLKGDEDSTPSMTLNPRRSPVENHSNKSPSKIPLPTWYPKCSS